MNNLSVGVYQMSDDKCERCGNNYTRYYWDDCDVCIVCLAELEFEEQYKLYVVSCQQNNTIPMSEDDWMNQEELD